eukprot:Em0001g3790a
MYTEDKDPDDQNLCVVEHKPSGVFVMAWYSNAVVGWRLELFKKVLQHMLYIVSTLVSWRLAVGLVLEFLQVTTWQAKSSSMQAFSCAGMLSSQFLNFYKFAEMDEVKQQYSSSGRSLRWVRQYQQIIAEATEEYMKLAVEHVKGCPHYATTGETSAQSIAQTREVACTKIVLPQVIDRGLNITEVAHDYQTTVKNFAGTKNVAEQMRKICAGTAHTRDKTWFPELSDKGVLIPNTISIKYSCKSSRLARSTKVHLYWRIEKLWRQL